jgi:hypothetical protein
MLNKTRKKGAPQKSFTHAPTSEATPVSLLISVDFPTDGNPTNPTRATPVYRGKRSSSEVPRRRPVLFNNPPLPRRIQHQHHRLHQWA